jgi:signal transduction histidine kinase
MSSADTARQLAFEAAEHRVLQRLRPPTDERSRRRRPVAVSIAVALFAATFVARLVINDPSALIANFYVAPIAVLAIEFGTLVGVLAAGVAMALVVAWSQIQAIDVGALGYLSRGAALLVTGAVVGWFSQRLRADIARRQRAQRDLALYADELERANDRLTLSVLRLEAFAEIARAVGGETELERVLDLITLHGREIVGARRLVVCLADGDALVALVPGGAPTRLALDGSLAGEALASGRSLRLGAGDVRLLDDDLLAGAGAAILVPLVFRGETLGVLAGIDRVDGGEFGDDEQLLLLSVAASAATAVATARSVAAEHLRLSLEAAEQARGRWARELHDETLQGLSGVRMVLGAGLGRGDHAALRHAAETADEHLGAEMRGLRDLITELRPAALDDLGLGPAIESLVDRQSAAGGFQAQSRIELGGGERSRELEGAAYRIVQEALNNVVRHAGAGRVTLDIRRRAGTLEIVVGDDGRGFATEDVTADGFGLAGMRERALLLGGTLSVRSRPGGPTRVTARLPERHGVGVGVGTVSRSSSGTSPPATS